MTKPSPDTSAGTLPNQGAASGLPRLALAVIAMGIGGLAISTATSDREFANRLDQALANAAGTSRGASSPHTANLQPPIAGSEAFWLDHEVSARPIQKASWTARTLSPGDRFSFAGGGERRVLEVTDVRRMSGDPLSESGTQKSAAALLLVTLRDTANTDATPVRLLVDANAPLAGLLPLPPSQHRDL